MNITSVQLIGDDRASLLELLLELMLVTLILLCTTITGYAVRKKIGRRAIDHERASEAVAADT